MPGLRIQYFLGPVWGKTNEQIKKQIVEGNNPISGKPVMKELVEKLTKPLTSEETKTGELKRNMGPPTFTGTEDELQKLFIEKRYTDFLPVILPTEARVNEMLKFTSKDPNSQLGRMNPQSQAGETWTYTVKIAAINAVMAGAKPEYFPVILAIGSTGTEGISVSDNGFCSGAIINGKIRSEIGLNYEVGAVGPFAQSNLTIGRAWNLLSINGANLGKVGTTYMGTVGNPMNLVNIIIAENEEASPWEPFSVRGGGGGMMGGGGGSFKKGDNVVTLMSGWGILSAKNWKADAWGPNMNYPQIIKDIFAGQDSMFGTIAVLSPPIANFCKDAGYDTVEKFAAFVTGGGGGGGMMGGGMMGGGGGFGGGGGGMMGGGMMGGAPPAGGAPKPGASGGAPAGASNPQFINTAAAGGGMMGGGGAGGGMMGGAPPAGGGGGRGGAGGGFGGGGFGGGMMGGGSLTVVVTGASNNNYWCMGGMRPGQKIAIDRWR